MDILVFGKTGQVGRVLATLDGVTCVGREAADLSSPERCVQVIENAAPEAVINAAAYTDIDKAEQEEPRALVVNGDAPKAMAAACAERGIPFVHLSTDHVFRGDGTAPWQPMDAAHPQSAYGRTRLAGEGGVRAAGGVHAILRTSRVVSAHGDSFVRKMLRLGAERGRLSLVSDQIGAPTGAHDIAAACHAIAHQLALDPAKSGTYHFAGAPDTSWADFAREIFAQAGVDCVVTDMAASEDLTPAKRPLNTRLDCRLTEETFGLQRPDWKVTLAGILQDIGVDA